MTWLTGEPKMDPFDQENYLLALKKEGNPSMSLALDCALSWIDRHFVDDPDADMQALRALLGGWRSMSHMGRIVSVDFEGFCDRLNAYRYADARGMVEAPDEGRA